MEEIEDLIILLLLAGEVSSSKVLMMNSMKDHPTTLLFVFV